MPSLLLQVLKTKRCAQLGLALASKSSGCGSFQHVVIAFCLQKDQEIFQANTGFWTRTCTVWFSCMQQLAHSAIMRPVLRKESSCMWTSVWTFGHASSSRPVQIPHFPCFFSVQTHSCCDIASTERCQLRDTSEGQALEAIHVEGTNLLRGSRRFFATAAA